MVLTDQQISFHVHVVGRPSTAWCPSINGPDAIALGPLKVRDHRDTLSVQGSDFSCIIGTMLTLTGDFGTLDLDSSLANAHTRFALANGFCGNLAEAILDVEPDRAVYFVTYDLEDSEELEVVSDSTDPEIFHNHVTHVLVASPGSMLLDAYGVSSTETLEKFYGGRIIEGTRVMLRKHYVTDSFIQDRESYSVLARSALEIEAQGLEFNRSEV